MNGTSPPSRQAAADWAAQIAERLPASDLRQLARAADSGRAEVLRLRGTTGSALVREACDEAARWLAVCPAQYVAGMLDGAAAGMFRAREQQSVSVAWTGPESQVRSARLTSAAVTELIDSARSSIMLVSYATRTEPSLDAALSAAVARGVEVTLVAERQADNPRYSGADTPFPDLAALRLHWPARSRPPGASLHAKIIVVDSAVALVGSANLTSRAMESNLECGILLHGGPAPRVIRDHLTSLYATGTLRRL